MASSPQSAVFVEVDRNAIESNDRTGNDVPVIVVHGHESTHVTCRELEILDAQGNVVARFLSQSRRRQINNHRPHVWFELEGGSVRPVG